MMLGMAKLLSREEIFLYPRGFWCSFRTVLVCVKISHFFLFSFVFVSRRTSVEAGAWMCLPEYYTAFLKDVPERYPDCGFGFYKISVFGL